jgi:hypothetical protein
MTTTVNGTTGVSQVQDNVIVAADIKTGETIGMTLMQLATAQASTSGTSIDFTGIPSWAKRITVLFDGMSTNGTSNLRIQIGDSGGVETSGYLGSSGIGATFGLDTGGFSLSTSSGGTSVANGVATINLLSASTNTWCFQSALGYSNAAGVGVGAGSKSLTATLDRIRITTVNGTDTFDAGNINILMEGYQ